MGAIGISFLKKKQNRDLGDFFDASKEEGYTEIQDAELEQYDETDYIN
ncbi:hypothetical protein GF358_01205 [Candidatus Woesearchaeota archaeon]|nr:hypothetical protein [Candidatus Woesearchaeota archaeon]